MAKIELPVGTALSIGVSKGGIMKQRLNLRGLKTCLYVFLLVVLIPVSVLADRFSDAYTECTRALGPETDFNLCVKETCAYRACVAAQAVQIISGDLTYNSSNMSTIPAECAPHIQVMQTCINESMKRLAMKHAPPPSFKIGSTWRVVEICPGRKWIGTWKRRPGTETFDATWTQVVGAHSDREIRDVIDFKGAANGQVSLYRRGIGGSYTGRLSADGGTVQDGHATWYPDGCSWTAEINGAVQ